MEAGGGRAPIGGSARPNTIAIQGQDYVLAWVGGHAAHLVAKAKVGGTSRTLVGDARSELNPAYEAAALMDPTWSVRTLCGRDGWFMCPTDAGRAFQSPWNGQEQSVAAPTCRRCLRILDNCFPEAEPDERLAWNVARAVEELELWGSFGVRGVPGDQTELLRKGVRAEARRRGWKFSSSVVGGVLIGSSENSLTPQQRDAVTREAMQRMDAIANDVQLPQPSWRFDW